MTTTLQAHRIAETADVRLPVMICEDGFNHLPRPGKY